MIQLVGTIYFSWIQQLIFFTVYLKIKLFKSYISTKAYLSRYNRNKQ